MTEVITVKDVSKHYRIFHDKGSTLKEKILFRSRNRYEDRWVLNGVSFSIQKGETIGLIGENGSGKSTLLKLLTRIIYPNSGEISLTGKVSSLLELGAGFHPDMTGRENIYMNASIFGLTRREIDDKLEEIIAFSELESFIDNPVRTYSSGMYMRLAFSVAINVDPDILLIDEILAVGDVNFQKKCFYKMRDIKAKGVTVVIVTHDLSTVEKICDRVIWIDAGYLRMQGEPKPCINAYLQNMKEKQEVLAAKLEIQTDPDAHQADVPGADSGTQAGVPTDDNRWGSREVEITDVGMYSHTGEQRFVFSSGEPVMIRMDYERHREVKDLAFGVGIFNQEGIACYGTNTQIDDFDIQASKPSGSLRFVIEELLLVEGKYTLDIAAHAEDGRAFDYHKKRYRFEVVSEKKDIGICRLKHNWEIS